MSVIAAKIDSNMITVAADSILTKDGLKRINFHKLIKINDMIIGGCGCAEELSLFFQFAKDKTLKDITTDAVLDYMLSFSKYKSSCVSTSEIENAYILIYKGHVFETDGLFVQEVTNYTAIGEGETYALAALHLGHDVDTAVKTAAHFCCNVSEPTINFIIYRNQEETEEIKD